MTLKWFSRTMGRLWGKVVVRHIVAWMRRRASRLDLVVCGGEHLRALAERPFVMASNHIVPHDSPLGPFAALRFIRQYNHSADSFLFHHAVRGQTGRTLLTAARCDGGRWSDDPWKRPLQKRLGQPFAWGQMEALTGYIPVEQSPGCWQRPFLEAVREAVAHGDALLIFPGDITLDQPDLVPRVHSGMSHIARRFAVPIVPACILGSDSWRPGHPVTIAFGPAFVVAGMTKGEISAEVIRRVQALHASHAAVHRGRVQAAMPPPPEPREARHVAAV